jgi:hypothetical protein
MLNQVCCSRNREIVLFLIIMSWSTYAPCTSLHHSLELGIVVADTHSGRRATSRCLPGNYGNASSEMIIAARRKHRLLCIGALQGGLHISVLDDPQADTFWRSTVSHC